MATYLLAGNVSFGSVGAQNRAYVEEFERQGHEVVVVDREWPSERPTRLRDALFLARIIRERRPQGILAHFGAVNVCLLVGWAMRVPVRVVWYHTVLAAIDRQPLRTFRKKLVYRFATRFVAISEAAKQDLLDYFGVPSHNIWVWHHAIDDPKRDRRQRRSGYVCVGRLHPAKGMDVALRASSMLEEPITFVGPGTEAIGGLGKLPLTDVLDMMAQAKAVVVPSRAEAFGMVAIEAMAVGTPVVASDVGGLKEIIRHGIDGYLVPPDDPVALSEALSQVRTSMGEAARDRFLERFSLKAIQGRVEAIAGPSA